MTATAGPGPQRTPARRKARQLARYLRAERPDYAYLKEVFRHLREELDVEVTRTPKKLPYVPTEAEIRAFYDAVWKARRASDVILIKTLLYTGVRVSELVRIRIADVDLDTCRIRITQGKGGKAAGGLRQPGGVPGAAAELAAGAHRRPDGRDPRRPPGHRRRRFRRRGHRQPAR